MCFPSERRPRTSSRFVGEEIRATVGTDDRGPEGNPLIVNGYAYMEMIDFPNSEYGSTVVPISGLGIKATEAEWIVEAPVLLGNDGVTVIQMPPAPFQAFELTDAYCQRRYEETLRQCLGG